MKDVALEFKKTHNTTKEPHIETLRGMACLALVSFHVVGSNVLSGMELLKGDWLALIQTTLKDLRMPLFSFISGYVFQAVPRTGQDVQTLVFKKIRRLMLPMLSVTTVFWMTRMYLDYTQMPLWKIYMFPYEIYWFLQATLLLMLSLIGMTALGTIIDTEKSAEKHAQTAAIFLGLLGGATWISAVAGGIQFFSFNNALYLAPFFMAGFVASNYKSRFSNITKQTRALFACLPAALIAVSYLLATGAINTGESLSVERSVAVTIGLSGIISLLICAPRNRFLAWLGGKSYAIYLFHVFFTAFVLKIWENLTPNVDIHFAYLPALIAGVWGPIVFERYILKSKYLKWVFLGLPAPKALIQPCYSFYKK